MLRLLTPGTRIAGRFLVEYAVGTGGMATIYRALDTERGQPVALKISRATGPGSSKKEFQWLASLSHPGIVRYIAHGDTADELRYLATEWLEGEDLSQRLMRQPLSLAETVALLQRLADALTEVHDRGIVHSDIKPSNIFLRDGSVAGTTLLDFGIARQALSQTLRSGSNIVGIAGTLSYLAPELARGETDLSPRADIFSLGCVLFECLTGQPPFQADHASGLLARILFDEPTPVRELNPAVPPSLADLLTRMLAKQLEERPRDARQLARELAALGELAGPAGDDESARQPTLTAGEQRLLTVIVAENGQNLADAGAVGKLDTLRSLLIPLGARVEQLASGTLVITPAQLTSSEATDQAEQAVRCALVLKEHWPAARVILATGRERVGHHQKTGEAVDRAMRLLLAPLPDPAAADGAGEVSSPLLLDEVTAGLVEMVFDVVPQDGDRFAIYVDQSRLDRTRLLLGRPTPFVGREHELGLLESILSFCVEESAARLLLVSAPPGLGKSRLRHEFLRRLSIQARPLTILLGRGDLMAVGAPYQLVASAVRGLCGIAEGDDYATQRAKLLAHAQLLMSAADAGRVAAFLGELCGVQFPVEQYPQLIGAYQNPRTMSAQVTRAWIDLLWAELSRQPVLLVLDDVHWGDALSVGLIHAMLRELSGRPLMVLALGRPEMEDLFPSLYQERASQLVRLGQLSRKASERLIRHALGDRAKPELVNKIIEQAGGSALYIEELIRAVAEDERDALPDTVLAMLEARLMRLDLGQRRVLRAASVFGESFDREGLRYLLGLQNTSDTIERWLSKLIKAELIERSLDGSPNAPAHFRFRHALVREAAYYLLTPDDRILGHQLAAQYLEAAGVRDPRVLAEHFRRGARPEQAAIHYLAAAERALNNSDLTGALECAGRGITCGSHGQLLGGLRAVQLQAHFWRDEWTQALQHGREALQLLPEGSDRWCRAAGCMLPITSLSGDSATWSAISARILASEPAPGAGPTYFQAASYLLVTTSLLGQAEAAAGLLELLAGRLQRTGGGLFERGLWKFGELVYQRMLCADPWRNYAVAAEATELTEAAGDLRTLLFVKGFLGTGLAELGQFDNAERVLRECLDLAQRLKEPLLSTHVRVQYELLLLIMADPQRLPEALASATLTIGNQRVNPLLGGEALANLAAAQLQSGDLVQAETSARSAAEILAPVPAERLLASMILIRSLSGQGRHDEARALAEGGLAQLRQGPGGYAELSFRLAAAEALEAAGDRRAAAATIHEAREALVRRAATIPDPAARARYLGGVADNARIQALAAAWDDTATG